MRKDDILGQLFFIGNGFDIQHNVHYIDQYGNKITSSLEDFSKVVEEKNEDLYREISDLITKCELSWNELEKVP